MTAIADVFDRAADTYDQVGVPWFGPIGQWLVAALGPQPGERALDVGCGRGAALLPLADAVGPSGSVLGVDLAPRMVAALAREVHDRPQAQVRVGDAAAGAALDAEGPFDLITSSLVLFFLADPAAALRSWVPLLTPAGRLGVTTFGAQDPRWSAVDAVFGPYLPPALRDARTSGKRGPFADDAGVEGLLRQAGLPQVRTVTRSLTAVFDDPEQWHAFSWSHGQRAMWEAVRAQAEQVLAGCRDEDGRLRLHQDIRITVGTR